METLTSPITVLRGIGPQKAKVLERLEIRTLGDLLRFYPRAYDDRSALRRIADLVPGETAGVAAMVASPPTISHIRKGLDLVKLRAVDDTGTLDVTFFNQAWLKNSLHQGETYIFYGRAEGSLLRHQMANPVVEPEGRREVTGRIVPIYPLTAGVSQLILSRSIRQGLDACADILPDVLPDRVRQHHQLCRIEYAYENIHFPEHEEALALARRHGAEIRYDETAQAPWFRYTAAEGREHEVWFEDARSSYAKFRLAAEKGLQGVGLWNLMRPAPQTYLALHGGFEIEVMR